MTHIWVSKPTIICSDNGLSPHQHQAIGLSPLQRQAIIWSNVGMFVIGSLETNFGEIWIKIVKIFIEENALDNIVCKIAAIFVSASILLKIEEVTVLLGSGPVSSTSDLQSCKIFIPETLLRYAHTRNISKILLSSAVITRSNLPWYYIRQCDNSGRKWI